MAAVSARERLPQRLPDIVFLTAALLLLIAGIFLATFVAMLGRPDTLESSMLAQSQADYQGEPSAPLFEPLDPDILDQIREDEEALQQSPTPRSEEAVQAEVQENDNAVAPDDIEAAANTPAASAPAAASATALPSPSHPATAPSPTISQTPAPGIVPPRPWASPTSSLFSRPTATVRATSPPTNTPSSPAQATATPAPASNASPTATLTPAPTRTNPPPTNALATSPAQATAAASATPAPTNTPLPAIAPSATPRATATSTPRPVPTQTPRPAPSSTPVPAPSATPVPQPTETAILVEVPAQLSPLLECVQDNGDGSYTAYFGYVNPNSTAVTISVGKDNRLVPPPEVRGQPTTFQPGRHSRAFTVDFTQGNVLWFLDGSTATAHVGRASCD